MTDDVEQGLDPEELERAAIAAYLGGRDGDGAELWERAHRELTRRGDPVRAARCAFWLGFCLMTGGDPVRGGGWLARAGRLLDDGGHDCAERGYLTLVAGLRLVIEGDDAGGHDLAGRALRTGERFGDVDLVTLARQVQGRALIRQGKAPEGMALLDEAMTALLADEVSPLVAGTVYCSVLEACHEILDVQRAAEWTVALTRWCRSQPGLVPFRGQCLVHRAEFMQLRGAWTDAIDEVRQACEVFGRRPADPAAGAAYYRQGELHRLTGRSAEAEEMYREAARRGREPQPGLALLRLAQGRIEAATAAMRRVLEEVRDPGNRCRMLAAFVEVLLAAGDVQDADGAADELSGIAVGFGAPLLCATADFAQASVLLATGDAHGALARARKAWTIWQELRVPYEAARARLLIASACRELGDEDGARMEADAARWAFQQLGATPDLAQVEAISAKAASGKPASRKAGGLTDREIEVLALVATGMTNRAIADDLVLSEKTVARHVSNILSKLGLPSRAAATAYAYEHDLL